LSDISDSNGLVDSSKGRRKEDQLSDGSDRQSLSNGQKRKDRDDPDVKPVVEASQNPGESSRKEPDELVDTKKRQKTLIEGESKSRIEHGSTKDSFIASTEVVSVSDTSSKKPLAVSYVPKIPFLSKVRQNASLN